MLHNNVSTIGTRSLEGGKTKPFDHCRLSRYSSSSSRSDVPRKGHNPKRNVLDVHKIPRILLHPPSRLPCDYRHRSPEGGNKQPFSHCRLSRSRRGNIAPEIIKFLYRAPLLTVVLVVLVYLLSVLIRAEVQTSELQAALIQQRIAHALRWHDSLTGMDEPNTLALDKLNDPSILDHALAYGEPNNYASVNASFYDSVGNALGEVFLNKIRYSSWNVLAQGSFQGPGGINQFITTTSVKIVGKNQTRSPGTLTITILIPRTT